MVDELRLEFKSLMFTEQNPSDIKTSHKVKWGQLSGYPEESSLSSNTSYFNPKIQLIDLDFEGFDNHCNYSEPYLSSIPPDRIIDSFITNTCLQAPLIMCIPDTSEGDVGIGEVEDMLDVEQYNAMDSKSDIQSENTSNSSRNTHNGRQKRRNARRPRSKRGTVSEAKFPNYILSKDLNENMICLKNDQPALYWKEQNSGIKITCPSLWNKLGDRYGAPLLHYKSTNTGSTFPSSLLVESEPFPSCQVSAVALLITHGTYGNAPSNETRKFIDLCQSTNYHLYMLHFPSPKTRQSMEKFTMEIVDSAIECWFVGWHIAIFIDSSSILHCDIRELVERIRKICDKLTLDIIIIHSPYVSKEIFLKAGSSVVLVKDLNMGGFLKKLSEMKNSETINFYNKNENYYEFTNFFSAKFKTTEFNSSWFWDTSEHYFQAHKFTDITTFRRIYYAYSPREAFTIARAAPNMRPEWDRKLSNSNDRLFKDEVMMEGVFHKFTENPHLKYKLLSTGDARLVEHTANDGYWGDKGDGSGLNKLGGILELLRETLFKTELERVVNTDHFEKRKLERCKWYINDLKKSMSTKT